MVVNKYLYNLLLKYDIYHSSIIEDSKVELNINYKPKETVEIVLSRTKNNTSPDRVKCYLYDDFDFKSCVLPKIVEHFFAKNQTVAIRDIMGTKEAGTRIISRADKLESLVLRNCPKSVMNLIDSIYDMVKLSRKANVVNRIDISSLEKEKIKKYVYYNIALDYASYRINFMDSKGKANFFDISTSKSQLEKENRFDRENLENLIILDIARYGYKIGLGDTLKEGTVAIWNEIKEKYKKDPLISVLCENFKNVSKTSMSIFKEALICAEFEKNNEKFILDHPDMIKEALEAAANEVTNGSSNFLEYWDNRRRYYKLLNNLELEKICADFLDSSRLIVEISKNENGDVVNNVKKESLISKLKEVKETNRPDFSSIINDPITIKDEVSNEHLFKDENHEQLAIAAEEEAERIMEILKERDQIKKDAEEFAKIILKEQKERKKIIKAAEEQARRIFELEKENEELKRLAEEAARSIFEKEMNHNDEIELREVQTTKPISSSDIDKINYLLNSLSAVKELDFAVNHPTVMQEISLLEEKIFNYLSSHSSVSEYKDELNSSKNVIEEKKSPTELLAIIRNVYTTSHIYEKEGRHTLINIIPNSNQYKVTLYSVKNDSDDILTEVYFDNDSFDEEVIKELCDIYSSDAVIVASKTDNIPNGLGDYLVIDNQDNAIKFMECSKEIINIAKEYL